MAATYDITIEQGGDYALALTLKDHTGAAIDLTGATVYSHIRETWAGPKLGEFVVEYVDRAAGKVTLLLPSGVSKAIRPNAKVYDVLLVRASGITQRILEGSVTLSPSITRV